MLCCSMEPQLHIYVAHVYVCMYVCVLWPGNNTFSIQLFFSFDTRKHEKFHVSFKICLKLVEFMILTFSQ